jgi:GMP synthase-like glutamine amidotransferase
MKLKIHILQHVPYEDAGCIIDWCRRKQHRVTYTRFYLDETLPGPDEFDWLVIMGGPMGVYDEKQYPWLVAEKESIRNAIANHKTVLGICLGSQLIAEAQGARVYKNPEKEIGWLNVMLTGQGRHESLLNEMQAKTKVFHWHGDTFDLPANSRHLIFSEACKNQVFLIQKKVLGIQFHLEVTAESIRGMTEHGRQELIPDKYVQSEQEILSETKWIKRNNTIMFSILDHLAEIIP